MSGVMNAERLTDKGRTSPSPGVQGLEGREGGRERGKEGEGEGEGEGGKGRGSEREKGKKRGRKFRNVRLEHKRRLMTLMSDLR